MTAASAGIDRPVLPYVAGTSDVSERQREDHWRSVFNGLWGAVDLRQADSGAMEGSLHSRRVGDLVFNRIEFGHQVFERSRANLRKVDRPFYSLTFPERGEAIGRVGQSIERLTPGHAYLLNTGLPSELTVDREYGTFNILIPVQALERRLGQQVDLFSRTIEQPDPILHVTRKIVSELTGPDAAQDSRTSLFLSEQLLDLVAYFLQSGGRLSEDTLAKKAMRERVSQYLDHAYHIPTLTPQQIASDCGISRSYLYKLFPDDAPIMELVKKRRLDAAYRLIANSNGELNLTRIAMDCGFTSSSEFSRLFKAHFGTPPSRV